MSSLEFPCTSKIAKNVKVLRFVPSCFFVRAPHTNVSDFFSSLPECPSGWVDGGNLGCYYGSWRDSTMSHSGAKAYCKSLDRRAHLTEIRTREIQTFVEGLLEHYLNYGRWWLGGNDKYQV